MACVVAQSDRRGLGAGLLAGLGAGFFTALAK